MIFAAALVLGTVFLGSCGDSRAEGPQTSALVPTVWEGAESNPWLGKQDVWFRKMKPGRYLRKLGYGTCESLGETCQWLAYANQSGYVQVHVSVQLSDATMRLIRRIEGPVENWRASAEMPGSGNVTASWIGTEEWTTRDYCNSGFSCNNQKTIDAIMRKLKKQSIIFQVTAYLR